MPDDPQKLIETAREALDTLCREVFEYGQAYEQENSNRGRGIVIDNYSAYKEAEIIDLLASFESALGEKTVPMEMLKKIGDDWITNEDALRALIAKCMPGYTVK
jgi:hypothetical protein